MSHELESVANNLYDNIVPAEWKKYSYNSMKPLASYIADLLLRLIVYVDWIKDGACKCCQYGVRVNHIDSEFRIQASPI